MLAATQALEVLLLRSETCDKPHASYSAFTPVLGGATDPAGPKTPQGLCSAQQLHNRRKTLR